jgi:hypothetical protein
MLGHNSIGLVPLFVAFAVPGWHLWRVQPSRAQSLAVAQTH